MRKDLKYKDDEWRKDGHMHAASFLFLIIVVPEKNTGLQASLRCLFRNIKRKKHLLLFLLKRRKQGKMPPLAIAVELRSGMHHHYGELLNLFQYVSY